MRTSLAGRSGPAGLACRLVLALALAACGGADDGGGGAESAAAETSASASVAAAGAAAADSCTAPPPSYTRARLTGPWQGLVASLAADGVTFPEIQGNDDTTTIKLCRTCSTVRVEIRASNRTPCLRRSDLGNQGHRVTGMFILLDTFPAQHGWDTIPAGDTVFTFANSPAGRATLIYDRSGNGKQAPEKAWNFWFCADSANNGKTPQAQWRPRGTPPVGSAAQVGEDGGGSYGWMACASGCCQFYTPPPNETIQTTAEQANEKAPDTVGVGVTPVRPYWCPTG